jgi:trypsin
VLLATSALALTGSVAQARPGDGGVSAQVVNGSPASEGEYPAQAYVSAAAGTCGGTLVGGRMVLTAAHCAVGPLDVPLPAASFDHVCIGQIHLPCDDANKYAVTDNEVHPEYDGSTNEFDVAMLTLDEAPPETPLRVVELGEAALWAPGTSATVVGWGETSEGGSTSSTLLEAQVPMRSDADCDAAYADYYGPDDDGFFAETMVCAGNGSADTCAGDSGGPLMVSDGTAPVLVGATSWGEGCNDPEFPGVYARLGSNPLNGWVLERTPRADFSFSPAAPVAGQTVNLSGSSSHPDANGFDTFRWDLDGDGGYDDHTGASATRAFVAGSHVVGFEASSSITGDRAVRRKTITASAGSGGGDAGGAGAGSTGGGGTAGGDTGGGSTGGDSTPADRTAPRVRLSGLTARLSRALSRGFATTARCSERCRLTARLVLPARMARRLGLARTIARASATLRRGRPRVLRLRFSAPARNRLERRVHLRLVLRVSALDAAGNRRNVTRVVRLSR